MTMPHESKQGLARHERDCGVCHHLKREEIEHAFISWTSPSKIAKTYNVSRSTLYRHATACGLMEARQKNVAGALANFIERCARVRPSAAAFVSAVIALSKLNEQGQTVDRVSLSSLNQAFARFSRDELEKFATEGILPDWYLSGTENASPERLQ